MNLAVKYEVTHFVDDARVRHSREDKKRAPANRPSSQDRPSKGKPL
ncbi:hypothetical protein PC129_g23204 [Phytophthora cactorum]|uniref:Uncharacterized protein n=1 Tax=Phytophthora cactorum TaxID=29920 RepID=A0A329REL5_9STRA|nr:hypothetical protein Pcac1_g10633 [Phytophthora cactorum]KAG2792920.1 hypothetical protein PC112_g23664 [Phytophthora cactorum]KAG2814222.1 hypothetical protein PC113_g23345 [Phytophthora cactorum]KAG2818695.1 hypothetical protein PC111_g12208 [Phytophthora cactorum]KAG2872747.1 hypothetical protein PC114_g26217 [Phytophthora cactorum]